MHNPHPSNSECIYLSSFTIKLKHLYHSGNFLLSQELQQAYTLIQVLYFTSTFQLQR